MIKERIEKIRGLMRKNGIDAYLIPSSDYHESEYVGEYFKAREFISGFTGSAGTAVVTLEEAGLFTDGRYFIQAEKQLENTGIKLFKMGEEGVPTIKAYLEEMLQPNATLGYDGKVVGAKEGINLRECLGKKDIKVVGEQDLVGEIWDNRPPLSNAKAFLLEEKYSGESAQNKLEKIREIMRSKQATFHIITTLDDIAWLFNIRGGDVKFNPVVLSYAVIGMEKAHLFVDKSKLDAGICAYFQELGVALHDYEEVYVFVATLNPTEVVLLDPAKVNDSIYNRLPKTIKKIEEANPSVLLKAKKNEVELENIRQGHLKDGIAFTKFMYWLKTNVGKMDITEMSASDKMESLRKEQEGFLESSFHTIAAYKEHAAMMHYSATEESNYALLPEHLFLIDSGGQYYEGTTDITRTIVLGELEPTLKLHFTTVVRSMLNLSRAQFLQGIKGHNLDILARGPLWQLGLDYKCGTGHGVGYLLNVHEAPNGFRWKIVPERNDSCELEEGMVTTNEPGVYIEGSHGIRIENELILEKREKNEYGQFMGFETVTFAPIDLDGIEESLMNEEEKQALNKYHQMVYTKIAPFLTAEERKWLKVYTRDI